MRYRDDTPQKYRLDLEQCTQTNCETGYTRKIQRCAHAQAATSSGSATTCWEFQDVGGGWKRYHSSAQGGIDGAYCAYAGGKGSARLSTRFPPRPETYELDFARGSQTNTSTCVVRQIRRA